jgi:hypothetical protein
MDIAVCLFAVNFMSVQSTAVKCVIGFIYSPALATDPHTFIKSLCALAIIPRHPK